MERKNSKAKNILTPNMTPNIIMQRRIHMSQWEKLLHKILMLEPDVRFEELKKILENYGYKISSPKGGSSHCTFRKQGCSPVTIPRHKPIKKVYVEMVREIIEKEDADNEKSR